MKKIQILFAAVIMTAVFSAFTTKKPTTVYFRNALGQFEEKTMEGICDDGPYHCEYEWVGTADPGNPNNPANYLPLSEEGFIFTPSN